MTRFICFVYITFIGFTTSSGQNQSLYYAKCLDPFVDHSAYAGLEGEAVLSLVAKSQWSKINGAPSSQRFQFHTPWLRHNLGYGIVINHDKAGLNRKLFMRPSVNKVFVGHNLLYSLGLYGLVESFTINETQIITPDGVYINGSIDHQDRLLLEATDNTVRYGIGFSGYFQSKWIDGGITYHNKWADKLIWTHRNDHLIQIQASHAIIISNKFKIEPLIALYSNFFQHQLEIFSKFTMNGNVFGGIGIRGYNKWTLDAVEMSMGYEVLPRILLFGNVSWRISSYSQNYFGISQELGLKYNFRNSRRADRIKAIEYNPRWTD